MRNITKCIIASFLFFFVNSCTEEFEPLFKENASQRFQDAKIKYDTILKNANNGWVLQYFPNREQSYGGTNFYINFLKKSNDSVSAKNEESKEWVYSTYALKQDGGLLLSFDTYNTVLHEYANPSSSEYQGKGGDYEFLVLSYENDVIRLKGKKTGNYMNLIKLKETPEDYNIKVKKIKDILSSVSLYGKFKDTGIDIDKTANKITFTYNNGDEKETESIAYLYTDKGIRLYEPLKIGEREFQEFDLDIPNKKLISENKEIELKLLYPPIDFTNTEWISSITQPNNASAKLKTAWDRDAASHLQRFPKQYELYPVFTLGKGQFNIYIQLGGQPYPIGYNLNFKATPNPNNIIIEKNDPTQYWNFIGLNSTLNLLIGEFKVELDNKDNPTKIKLTSVKDSDVWVNLGLLQ